MKNVIFIILGLLLFSSCEQEEVKPQVAAKPLTINEYTYGAHISDHPDKTSDPSYVDSIVVSIVSNDDTLSTFWYTDTVSIDTMLTWSLSDEYINLHINWQTFSTHLTQDGSLYLHETQRSASSNLLPNQYMTEGEDVFYF